MQESPREWRGVRGRDRRHERSKGREGEEEPGDGAWVRDAGDEEEEENETTGEPLNIGRHPG